MFSDKLLSVLPSIFDYMYINYIFAFKGWYHDRQVVQIAIFAKIMILGITRHYEPHRYQVWIWDISLRNVKWCLLINSIWNTSSYNNKGFQRKLAHVLRKIIIDKCQRHLLLDKYLWRSVGDCLSGFWWISESCIGFRTRPDRDYVMDRFNASREYLCVF